MYACVHSHIYMCGVAAYELLGTTQHVAHPQEPHSFAQQNTYVRLLACQRAWGCAFVAPEGMGLCVCCARGHGAVLLAAAAAAERHACCVCLLWNACMLHGLLVCGCVCACDGVEQDVGRMHGMQQALDGLTLVTWRVAGTGFVALVA